MAQDFVLTTLNETGGDPVIVLRSHIFYQPKKTDIFLNWATLEANAERLEDITDQLGWGQHQVFRLV